jgi:hypothetical protein
MTCPKCGATMKPLFHLEKFCPNDCDRSRVLEEKPARKSFTIDDDDWLDLWEVTKVL